LRVDSRNALVSIPVLKEILLMSRLPSSKTAQIWAERIAQRERSNTPVAQFGQSIGCSPTSYYQWKRKLAAKPQATAFLRVSTSEPSKDSIEIKLPEAGEGLEAIGVREQPLTTHHLPHMSPSGRLEVLGVRLSPAAYARRQFLFRPPGF
jgi:hypothetical protein